MTQGIKRCDKLIAYLKARLEAGGITYGEAVLIDDLLTLLSTVRSRVGELVETRRGSR